MKKTLCAMIAAVLLASCSAGAWGAYYDGDKDGSTWEKAYEISSYEDFLEFATRIGAKVEEGKYYKLTNDIEMSDTRIVGDTICPFTGHFDGNGHTINAAVFGVVSSDGIAIKNLNITGRSINELSLGRINAEGQYYYFSGCIAAYLLAGTIENCHYSGSMRRTQTREDIILGGIAGYAGRSAVIRNSSFSGWEIVIDDYYFEGMNCAGGVVGYLEGGTVEGCTVNVSDEIRSRPEGDDRVKMSYAGGIAGLVSGDTSRIADNTFTGKADSSQWAGGIVGYMNGGTLSGNKVIADENTFLGVNSNYSAGGIAGYLGGNTTASGNIVKLGYALIHNEGLNGLHSAGGIIGCLNIGTVENNSVDITTITGSQYIGAVIGDIEGYPNTIRNNYYNVRAVNSIYAIGYDSATGTASNEGSINITPNASEPEEPQTDTNTPESPAAQVPSEQPAPQNTDTPAPQSQEGNSETPDTQNTPELPLSGEETPSGNNTDNTTPEGENGNNTGEGTENSTTSGGTASGDVSGSSGYSGGSSGGCNAGFGLAILGAVLAFKRKH